jgi:rubrerythrin
MGLLFDADEIFEIAEEVERNGAKFYRKAAKNASDKQIKDTLLQFAAMEDAHEVTFAAIRSEIQSEISYDPEGVAALYLQAIADANGFEGKVSPDEELTGSESIEEVIKIALRAEKESVAFYVGLKDIVAADDGKARVDAIIKEEMVHVAQLTNMLTDL